MLFVAVNVILCLLNIFISRESDGFYIFRSRGRRRGCKLPSIRQVLAAMFYNLFTMKLNKRDSATTTVDEVFVFFFLEKLEYLQNKIKLYDDWKKMQKYKDRKM